MLRYRVQKTAKPSAAVVTSGGRLMELELQPPAISKSKATAFTLNFFENNSLSQDCASAGYWFSVS